MTTTDETNRLLAEVAAALDAAGIYHDVLRLNAKQHNITVTDDLYVFCKITREGFEPLNLALELRLALHYGDMLMLRPRVPQLMQVGDRGQWMSVWAWEMMANLWSDKATTAESAAAAELLVELHGKNVPAELYAPRLESFKFLADKMDQRFIVAAGHGLARADVRVLFDVYEQVCAQVRFDDPVKMRLSHGDPHFGNLVRRGRSQRLCYIDYESAQLSYPEFDFAALRTNLDIMGRNHAAWDAVQATLADKEVSLDARWLEIFTVARLVSMTSYGLLHPESYEKTRERLVLLRDYMETGNLPDHFPRVV